MEQTIADGMMDFISYGLSEGPIHSLPPLASYDSAHIWLLQLSFGDIKFSVNPHIYI